MYPYPHDLRSSGRGDRQSRRFRHRLVANECAKNGGKNEIHVPHVHERVHGACDVQMYEVSVAGEPDVGSEEDVGSGRTQNLSRRRNGDDIGC